MMGERKKKKKKDKMMGKKGKGRKKRESVRTVTLAGVGGLDIGEALGNEVERHDPSFLLFHTP